MAKNIGGPKINILLIPTPLHVCYRRGAFGFGTVRLLLEIWLGDAELSVDNNKLAVNTLFVYAFSNIPTPSKSMRASTWAKQ